MTGNELFYLIKGILGLLGTMLVLYHTNHAWDFVVRHGTYGQRWRYISLLAWMILVTGASAQQLHENAPIQSRNIGSLFVTIFTIIAMIISINEGRKKTDPFPPGHHVQNETEED